MPHRNFFIFSGQQNANIYLIIFVKYCFYGAKIENNQTQLLKIQYGSKFCRFSNIISMSK